MHRVISCLKEFHEAFGLPTADEPGLVTIERRHLRMKLLEDAYHEYRYAARADNLLKVAESLADMAYAIGGAALEYGIPIDKIFLEVHKSNMSKLIDGQPNLREDGKVLKVPGYHKPDVAAVLCDELYGEEDAR